MYQVATRDVPARSVLCLKRNIAGEPAAWEFGKEFISVLRGHRLPLVDGQAGAAYCIYWAEVTGDSDGPVEWCRPVPSEQAEQIATRTPELTLRREPAHREAFIHLGPGGKVQAAEWPLISDAMHSWVQDHAIQPSGLGARITYLASDNRKGPETHFALPMTRSEKAS